MDEENTTSMVVPLDSDGFLRRECPTCEREFKWLAASDDEEAVSAPDGGHFCPYCAIQASSDAWHTPVQIEQAKAILTREFVEPELERFKRETERHSGRQIDISVDVNTSDEPAPLTETDDMRRVDFGCHPQEPVKVLDEWDRPVHCLLCGTPASGEASP